MLFNSYPFIFLFLPIVLGVFLSLAKNNQIKLSYIWLIISSLFFYGWWNFNYIGLLILSTGINFLIGNLLAKRNKKINPKIILFIGIIFNLSLLGYYKYANFFIENLNILFQSEIFLTKVILPLGISFFTFQQITYLVDSYYGVVKEKNFLKYTLFVTFFPQLIAGPIVHHKEILPQFGRKFNNLKKINRDLAIGLSIFILGLFKKVVIADGISSYPNEIFMAAENGITLSFFEAWAGAIAYSLQLYFDFSGYSDMAVGIARMFGINLPINFNSPYKKLNISEFWRNWHITLSRLIKEYLWDPLSLFFTRLAYLKNFNKMNFFITATLIPILISFFFIGLWHGAGWNFIIFGLLHGIYISLYSIWAKFIKPKNNRDSFLSSLSSWLVTYLCVVVGWVPFRAESFEGLLNYFKSMFLFNGISVHRFLEGRFGLFEEYIVNFGVKFNGISPNEFIDFNSISWIIILLITTLFLPNTYEIISKKYIRKPLKVSCSSKKFRWRPSRIWSLILSTIFFYAIISMRDISEFLYFQF